MVVAKVRPPAAHPCRTCPYRKDVPSGIWAPEEYGKLPEYDRQTAEQPPHMFLCHHNTGSLCAGWCAVHDMGENLGVRLGLALGQLDDPERVFLYSTSTPLFATGLEAALHGMRDSRRQGTKAKRAIQQLVRKKVSRG